MAAPGTLTTGSPSSASLELIGSQTDEPGDGSEEFYLEIWLNQAPTGQLGRFTSIDDRLYASASTLRELGLRWPGSDDATGMLPLDGIPGVQAVYERAQQKLLLTASLDAMSEERTHFGPEARAQPRIDPSTRAPGLVLNYDLYAQGNDDFQTYSGWNELRLFGVGPGIWSNSMVSRLGMARGAKDIHDTVRLDTLWQLDIPDSMVSVAAGDTVTGSLVWTRPTRIGGVRASRNFALQPYRVTTPLASFAGDAVLPSTVDLFINGIRQSSQQVQPGRFQIDSVPVISGAGQAQMVVTDINGQSQVVNFSLYNSTQLLQDGLTDWSVEAGFVRRGYGLDSFAYADQPMASATVRHGMGNSLTLEAHAQGTAGLRMAGGGGAMLLGERGGVLDFSAAASRDRRGSGHQYGAGYQWTSRTFNLSLGTLRASDGFTDVATLEGSVMPRRMERAFAGVSLPWGQFGVGYVRQDYTGDIPRSRFASLSWSRNMPLDSYLSLSANRDLDDSRGDSAFLFWSVPLARRVSLSASASHSGGRNRYGLEANRTVDSDAGGWGWRAQATAGDEQSVQAQVTRLHGAGQWDAGFQHTAGRGGNEGASTGFASATGSLLLMEGHFFAMRRAYDSFALVSTDGIPGVPVLLENRPIGRTDEDGLLLVTRLNAWENNRLEIDALKAPADVRLGRTEMLAVPWNGSGMLAHFPMRYSISVQVILTGADGLPLPAGSPVWLDAADPANETPLTVVGFDGLIYLQDPPAGARLTVRREGGLCTAVLPTRAQDRGFTDLGGVVCR